MAKHPYLPSSVRRRISEMPRIQRVLWALEAIGVAAIWRLLRWLDPDRAVRAARAVTSRIGPRTRKSRNVRANLAIMFPELGAPQRAALEREIWGQWGAIFADFAHIDRICGGEPRVEIVQRAALDVFSGSGRPAVFATAHLANFQIATWAGAQLFGARPTVLYQPDSNPFVDRMIRRRRGAIDAELVPRDGGMRALLRELERGRPVGLVVDSRHDGGEMVPFFGVDTPTLTTPARLALRFGCELVPVRVERVADGARFRVTFHEAVTPCDPSQNRTQQALDMTRQLNALFEQWIRERPDQWVIAKRRWPRRAAAAPRAGSAPTGALPAPRAGAASRWLHGG